MKHLRVTVLTCVHLADVHWQSSTRCGKLRLWKSACCEHHIASFERHIICLYQVAVTSWLLSDRCDSDAALERGVKGRSVLLEVRHDVLSWEKAIWIVALIRKARKLGHPVRRVEGERIPALTPPGLTHPTLFQHEVCSALLGEVVAEGKSCLPASDDHDFDLLGHLPLLVLSCCHGNTFFLRFMRKIRSFVSQSSDHRSKVLHLRAAIKLHVWQPESTRQHLNPSAMPSALRSGSRVQRAGCAPKAASGSRAATHAPPPRYRQPPRRYAPGTRLPLTQQMWVGCASGPSRSRPAVSGSHRGHRSVSVAARRGYALAKSYGVYWRAGRHHAQREGDRGRNLLPQSLQTAQGVCGLPARGREQPPRAFRTRLFSALGDGAGSRAETTRSRHPHPARGDGDENCSSWPAPPPRRRSTLRCPQTKSCPALRPGAQSPPAVCARHLPGAPRPDN